MTSFYRILIFCFLLFKTHPQFSVSGEVIYGFLPNDIQVDDKNKNDFYKAFEQMNTLASDINFVLKFNHNESFFGVEDQMESDLNKTAVSYAKSVISKGSYYFNKEKNILLRESFILDKNTLIKSHPSELKWTLSKESKMIDNYLCFKASRNIEVINSSGNHKFVIEAWYCPEIPLSFGPTDFNGLPGLILEARSTHYTFYVKSIKINYDKELTINPLKSNKIITEDEYSEELKGIRSNFGKE